MSEPAPLHQDDPDAHTTAPGHLVRNLTAEEYAATYADGEPHHLPADVLAAVDSDAARIAGAREASA